MKVILLSGKKRAGKDFFANALKEKFKSEGKSVVCCAYADCMKNIICASFGIDREELDTYKNNKINIYVNLANVRNPKSAAGFKKLTNFREFLQRFATEGMRAEFGEDVWVKAFDNTLKKYKDKDYVIVTDWRFKVEDLSSYRYDVLRVRIDGMFDDEADTHRSEIELDEYPNFDFRLDNAQRPDVSILLKDFFNNNNVEAFLAR